jgi:hypothetical protein
MRFSILFGLALLLALGAGGRALWTSHGRAVESAGLRQLQAEYSRAQAAVAALRLPAGVKRTSCLEGVCGRSALTPAQLMLEFRRALGPRAWVKPGCDPTTPPCAVSVFGHVGGSPAVAVGYWHLVGVFRRHPPRGALPDPHPNHQSLYFLGSDVFVKAVVPPGLDGIG